MTCCMNIRSSLVDCWMNNKSSRINRLICASDPVSLFVYPHHIRHIEKGEVYSVWIDPERAGFDRIFGLSERPNEQQPRWSVYNTSNKASVPRRLIWPLLPSENPSLANMRKAPAICSRSHWRSSSLLVGLGMWCSLFTSPLSLVSVFRAEAIRFGSTVFTNSQMMTFYALLGLDEWVLRWWFDNVENNRGKYICQVNPADPLTHEICIGYGVISLSKEELRPPQSLKE